MLSIPSEIATLMSVTVFVAKTAACWSKICEKSLNVFNFGSILVPFWLHFGSLWAPLEPLWRHWAPLGHHLGNLVDPRVKMGSCGDPRGQLMFQFGVHLGATFSQKSHIFFKKWLPTTTPQSRVVFIWFFWNFSDPGTLNIELPPAREHDFQKTT